MIKLVLAKDCAFFYCHGQNLGRLQVFTVSSGVAYMQHIHPKFEDSRGLCHNFAWQSCQFILCSMTYMLWWLLCS